MKECKFCKYFWNILISVDQLANTLLGGDPDMTISGRMGRWNVKPEGTVRYKISCTVCKFLDLFEKDHCEKIRIKELDEGKDQITE